MPSTQAADDEPPETVPREKWNKVEPGSEGLTTAASAAAAVLAATSVPGRPHVRIKEEQDDAMDTLADAAATVPIKAEPSDAAAVTARAEEEYDQWEDLDGDGLEDADAEVEAELHDVLAKARKMQLKHLTASNKPGLFV